MNERLLRQTKRQEEMRPSIIVLVAGVVTSVFFLGVAVISNTVGKNETTTLGTTLFFVGCGLLGLVFVYDYFVERYFISEEGMVYRSFYGLGPRRFLSWDEVRSVDYSTWSQWFVVKTDAGAKAHVSVLMTNLPAFTHAVLSHVPHEAISSRAKEMFRIILEQPDLESYLT